MEQKLLDLIIQIHRMAEMSDPVIYDLSCQALEIIQKNLAEVEAMDSILKDINSMSMDELEERINLEYKRRYANAVERSESDT